MQTSQIKKTILILATLLLTFFLSIKIAGEEVFIWQYELATLQDIYSSNFQGIHLFSGYYHALPFVALLILIGQIFLLMVFFIKKKKYRIIKIGLLLLWLALLLILINHGDLFFLLKIIPLVLLSMVLYWLTTNKIVQKKSTNG